MGHTFMDQPTGTTFQDLFFPLKGRILIADDNTAGVDTLTLFLADEGFLVAGVNSGADALEMIESFKPDVLILDVRMPGMDGFQVLQSIRENPATTELPVIMVTAMSDTQDVVYALELGANDYISKPPQVEILVARVRTQLKLKALMDQRRRDLVQLRQLDSMKDNFLAVAAHDLKNPLHNIGFGAELLKEYAEQLEEAARNEMLTIIGTIESASATMQVIVDDYLDLQTMRAGQFVINRETVDLTAVIKDVLDQIRVRATGKALTLETHLSDDLPSVNGNPDRLAQVIGNLVSNAIKFSPPGAVVTVRAMPRTTGGLRIEVEDNGPGIPAEEMDLLFQEFARLSNRPTGGEKSSGVGLSIARRLVELHGGTIGAKSVRGQGSTFWIELPESS
jgi:signal transduction histidine kinase